MRALSLYIFAIFFFSLPHSSKAWNYHYDNYEVDDYWMFRENNDQFWATPYEHLFPSSKSLLKFKGTVWGDPHIRNFSIWHVDQKFRFVYSDFDDSGHGSYFLDFLRLFSSVELNLLDRQLIIKSYIQGLKQEERQFLNEMLSSYDDLKLKHEVFQQKHLSSHTQLYNEKRLLKKKAGVNYPVEASFIKEFEHLTSLNVLDATKFYRKRGGSFGSERVLFIVEDVHQPENFNIIELKEILKPSTRFHVVQNSDDVQRINQIINKSWEVDLQSLTSAIEIADKNYIMRYRMLDYTDVLRDRMNSRNLKRTNSFASSAAYALGLFHSSQSDFDDAYIQALEHDHSELTHLLSSMSSYYRQGLKEASSQIISQSDRLQFYGDFRYRLQRRQEEGKKARAFQHKFRLRVGFEKMLTSHWGLGAMLQTTEDPRSSSIDFEDFFENKPIYIGLAYFIYSKRWPQANLRLEIGKTDNPFENVGSSEILWDTSINPEGLSIYYDYGPIYVRGGAYLLDERFRNRHGINQRDVNAFGLQLGQDLRTSVWRLHYGIGALFFRGVKGLDVDDTWEGDAQGNSVNNEDEFSYDYRNYEAYAELRRRLPLSIEIGVFSHYVQNMSATKYDQAYRFGLSLKYQDIDMYYARTRVEADAVFGAMTDSTPARGGTNYLAHDWSIEYDLNSFVNFRFRHLFARMPIKGFYSPNFQDKYHKSRLEMNISF